MQIPYNLESSLTIKWTKSLIFFSDFSYHFPVRKSILHVIKIILRDLVKLKMLKSKWSQQRRKSQFWFFTYSLVALLKKNKICLQ